MKNKYPTTSLLQRCIEGVFSVFVILVLVYGCGYGIWHITGGDVRYYRNLQLEARRSLDSRFTINERETMFYELTKDCALAPDQGSRDELEGKFIRRNRLTNEEFNSLCNEGDDGAWLRYTAPQPPDGPI